VSAAAWWAEVDTTDADGTRALGAALAPRLRPGDLVCLAGGLGAGKTTFTQGLAAGLGIAGPVTSPTFTLVRHYRCEPGAPVSWLLHADLYRLDTMGEVADLGLAELLDADALDGTAVAVVEWGDVAAPEIADGSLLVDLGPRSVDEPDARRIRVRGRGERWTPRKDAVRASLESFGAQR
jgi:tRNA threonylcarbamoyladenosine biosynthesis protein TsaE